MTGAVDPVGRSRLPRSRDGTVRLRPDGHWEARYRVVDADGRQHRSSIYGATRQEVSRQLVAAMAARDRGATARDSLETVESYLATWLQGAKLSLRPRTWGRYEALLLLYIVPGPGHRRLGELRP